MNSGTTFVGSNEIFLNPSQISNFISGANNVSNKTLGWGMTTIHEILHSNVAQGGAIGHGNEKTSYGSTGAVVDRMNVN